MTRRLLLAYLLSAATMVLAGQHRGRRPRRPAAPLARAARRPMREAEAVTLDDAVSLVRRRVEGRVLAAERRRGLYRVRVLTPDGRVRRFRVDPLTGEFR